MANDDRARFEEERRRQAEAMKQLEQGFLSALTAWLTGIAGQIISSAVQGFWNWLKGIF